MKNFVNFLKSQSLSHKTIRNYSSDVNQFLAWVGNKTLDVGIFAAYKTHLESHRSEATLTRHLSALRQFARFLSLDINLDNPPLPLIPNLLKNFRAHLTKSRYKHKTVANYLSDIRHYLNWVESHVQS